LIASLNNHTYEGDKRSLKRYKHTGTRWFSCEENAGQNQNVKMDNTSFARMEHFKYLETTLTDQNPIHEEIKSSLNLGNACCLLSSSLLSKNVKAKIKYTEL
jgi:hypothetical protein